MSPPKSYEDPLLVYWTDSDKDFDIPKGQVDARRKWKSTILIKGPAGHIDEYELSISQKLKLTDYLQVVRDRARELADPQCIAIGFKIW